jgi:hypothetical protein
MVIVVIVLLIVTRRLIPQGTCRYSEAQGRQELRTKIVQHGMGPRSRPLLGHTPIFHGRRRQIQG